MGDVIISTRIRLARNLQKYPFPYKLNVKQKKEINKNVDVTTETVNDSNNLSEVERIILDLDVNNISPMQAFNVLTDLNEKLKEKYE